MKNIITIAVICCITFATETINAQCSVKELKANWKCIETSYKVKDIGYDLYIDTVSNEYCAIVCYTGRAYTKIPSHIKYERERYTVRGISRISANTIEILIPKTVLFIESYTCFSSGKIERISFEEGSQLRIIEDQAFSDNKSLHSFNSDMLGIFNIPDSVESIGTWAFKGTRVKNLRLPKGLKVIKYGAFENCRRLETISSQNEQPLIIDNSAFYNCSSLIIAKFKDIITSIGSKAFENNVLLREFKGKIRRIEPGAFRKCINLTTIRPYYYADDNNQFKDVIFLDSCNIGSHAFDSCVSIKNVVTFKIDTIGEYAFHDCESLNEESFGSSLKVIGAGAFNNCTQIKKFYLSDSIKYIGDYAFFNCKNLEYVYGLENNIDKIELGGSLDVIFHGCSKFDYNPIERKYSVFAKRRILNAINEWQKKKEYETTSEWRKRVTEENRSKYLSRLIEETKQEYIKIYAPTTIKCSIISYDADAGVFEIYVDNLNNYSFFNPSISEIEKKHAGGSYITYAKVPHNDAPKFKEQWDSVKIEPQYCIKEDYLGIASCKYKLDGKTYESPILYDDETANIELNLSPLNIFFGEDKNSITKLEKYDDTLDKNIPSVSTNNNKTFAIIIGNENYKEVSNVRYALNDAKIFAEYCQKTLGLPKENIRNHHNATYGMILSAINDIKSISEAYNGDVKFIFYYCGHGIPNEKTQEAYLLPVDVSPNNTDACYSITRLYKELGEIESRTITVFIDACFSGAQRGEGMLVEARGVAIKAKSAVPQGNMVVFTAASGDETAYPYKEKGHGMFTYFLLKKLNETKGEVTLGELGDYITSNVKQQSVVVNRKSQTPSVTVSQPVSGSWRNYKLR